MRKINILGIFLIVIFFLHSKIYSQEIEFETHTIVGEEVVADGARSVYSADVNGDGDMDVLSASKYDDKIAWYENDGDENFNTHIITTDADWAYSVYAVDMDNDGDKDVLSASLADSKITWYENDGNEIFIDRSIVTSMIEPWSVYSIDLDQDGDLDVLSAS